MLKNFNLQSLTKGRTLRLGALKDTQVLIRLFLGILLAANIVAAGFAFHFFDDSPQKIADQVQRTRQQVLKEIVRLNSTRAHAGKVDKGREEGTRFITTYMTQRRSAYSTILSEIDAMATAASMKSKDRTISFDAIPGTDALDMMTITANFETNYQGLVKFLTQVDRSKRFLIIENVAAVPQSNQNGMIQVTIKMNTFVKEDPGV